MTSLLHSLKAQKAYPKFYFQDGDDTITTSGAEEEYRDIPPSDALYVGGMDFFQKERKEFLWDAFPLIRFVRPFHIENDTYHELTRISPWRKCHHTPELPYYEGILQEGRIRDGKIVFARRTTLTFDEEIDPFSYLSRFTSGIRFLFSPSPGVAFIGASPEPLFRRNGLSIETAAIAGTRPRGKTPAEDALLRAELIKNEKERREFDYVSAFIEKQLHTICSTVSASDIDIITTPTVQHLSRTFTGTLKTPDDSAIIRALHPTPATGGIPREEALKRMYDLEPFDRGWYASPIGYISPEKSAFAVALRSALVIGNEAHLFAGSGIVDGSTPESEWEELNHKIAQFQ